MGGKEKPCADKHKGNAVTGIMTPSVYSYRFHFETQKL